MRLDSCLVLRCKKSSILSQKKTSHFVIVLVFAKYQPIFDQIFSLKHFVDNLQGSVATQLRCGGIFSGRFVANCPQSVPVKEF